NDLHLVPDPQGRDRPLADAAGQEREFQRVLQVPVPAHRPLLLVVGIYDDLHRDPFLTGLVPLGLLRLSSFPIVAPSSSSIGISVLSRRYNRGTAPSWSRSVDRWTRCGGTALVLRDA